MRKACNFGASIRYLVSHNLRSEDHCHFCVTSFSLRISASSQVAIVKIIQLDIAHHGGTHAREEGQTGA